MGQQLDTSLTSYQAVQNVETVTLRVKTGEGTYTTQTVANAKRRVTEAFHDTLLSQQNMPWHLWAAFLAGTVPKENDEIEDAQGVRWVIQRVRIESLRQRFRCETTKL